MLWHRFIGIMVFAALASELSSCGTHSSDTQIPEFHDAHSHDALGVNINPRRKNLSADDLNSLSFALSGLEISLSSYQGFVAPTLSYQLPQDADYVVALRCKVQTIIESGMGTLNLSQLQQLAFSGERALFSPWSLLEEHQDCSSVVSAGNDGMIVDLTAPSGSWLYVVHACIEAERRAEPEASGCSELFGLSPSLNNYVNKRLDKEQSLGQALAIARVEIDTIGRQIFTAASTLNEALLACQAKESNRQHSVAQKAQLAKVLGQGPDFVSTIVNGSLKSNSGVDILQNLWGSGNATNASPLAKSLNDLFSQAEDYPRSCTAANRAASEGQRLTLALKAATENYANLSRQLAAAKEP